MNAVQSTQTSATTQAQILSSLNGTSSTTTIDKTNSQDRFLTLLVTQLKNQDPLNPMDNAQVTSQLAQISTVDGIEKLNQTLQALTTNSIDSEALQAAALVGHGVLMAGSGMELSSGMAIGGVDLTGPADGVTVTIKDSNGLVVKTLNLGGMEAGSHAFSWDGAADNGSKAADGNYSVSVAANRGGSSVGVSALQLGTVSSVVRSASGVSLNVSGLGTAGLGDIKQIL